MKRLFCKTAMALVAAGCIGNASLSCVAQTLTNSSTFVLNKSIPDGDLNGVSDTHVLTTPILSLTDIQVSLDISCEFTGDLYAYLTHGSAFSVLLNRAGRTATNSIGYTDYGFNVTFDTTAANDIHNYQLTVNPNGGVLTGNWQPDARNVHPYTALDTTPRTADLSSFLGANPNGAWTLYLVDGSAVGLSSINRWTLNLIGVVPEPGTWALLSMGLAAVFVFRRRQS